MAQVDPVTSHNTDNLEDREDDGIYEGASAETIAAREAEIADETDDEPVQVAPIRYEPVYTWPSHGILVGELSYADFGDLGKSQGGGVGLGHVMMTAENAKMIPLRECIVLYKEASGVRWLNQGKWYRFLDSENDVVAVLSSVESDPRIANLQAIQQAESAREVLFNTSRTPDRLVPERDWTQFP